ncbi:MAG: hypothetical protein LAT76_06610, partial [Schleiferiaceae bacterium]|nr:hypothetical protein [Schleiferiaceae bacterium]
MRPLQGRVVIDGSCFYKHMTLSGSGMFVGFINTPELHFLPCGFSMSRIVFHPNNPEGIAC